MITNTDIVAKFAGQWPSLKAWRANLPMDIEIKPHKGEATIGLAWSRQCRALIRTTRSLVVDLDTVIHELAHLAAPNHVSHGAEWRELYVAGLCEALGDDAHNFETDCQLADLQKQGQAAVEHWLRRTGQWQFLKTLKGVTL